ncbi:RluA family pseudouridine synthase [Leadbettera azotonutricia]|uniref:Ribosomal large subunit pseudouridine synthase family protein n=1 Tax=Leadbettera azotonutricia (strain ATCC BAA-888 / DSM 13862 / ZAS-9) TaxID=545695 RepID=F5Y782_LEAAZ|nr:RluA family pseudouridine synthase [Leadbettera azotonutricia]AEF81980.1 ribosomal large subunit pseudouridine synthase family protein [Leadbettera azotonutricia ZAS-9]
MIEESRILWQNKAAMVINKQPGEKAENDSPFPCPVHRLDMPVSGCLLLAQTPEARAFLFDAFKTRNVEKRYWAVVEAPAPDKIPPDSGELTHWLMTDTKRNKSLAYGVEKKGSKKASLRYRIAGRGDHYLFMEIELLTGRHHQIRAQLAALGLHIKGDVKYGARRGEKGGAIRLHASSLSFPNPLKSSETIRVEAPPPMEDNLWDAFRSSLTQPE